MKVVAFNGSPRKVGNTSILIDYALAELEREGVETEVYQLGGKLIRGCMACNRCKETRNGRCAIESDVGNECFAKIWEADGVILASPTYFTDVTAEIKALIDRVGYISGSFDNALRYKVGAAIVSVRRGGSIQAFDTINHLFLKCEMIVPGSSYWNMGIGREKGDVEEDEEGIRTIKTLGQNMAWLLKKLA